MTDDKPKKYGTVPRQLYASDPHKAALEDEARLDRAYQRGRDDAAKKAVTKAETAAKPLAKPRKRKPGGGRPKTVDEPWARCNPPMSRAAWYRQRKETK